MLVVDKLTCVRGDRRLFEDLSFTLNAGELLYLRGHNGSGKTSLMNCLCGLIAAESGEIRFNGKSTRAEYDEFCRELLYIGHKSGTKDDLTATENLRFCQQLGRAPVSVDAADSALARMGLRGFEDLPTRTLSQGQRRRVALARLLLSDARLWVLDEPFTALDVDAVEQLRDTLRAHLDGGGLVVLSTHQDVDISERVVELQLGRSGGRDD